VLEEFGVTVLEQPVVPTDLDGLTHIRRHARIPLIADESCVTAADIPALVGRVDGINIKLAKCGSLREALRMIAVARTHGMMVMVGCMI
jgi:L-alanine-DL-glutamate epimerase-like enolase superfamily enzyme